MIRTPYTRHKPGSSGHQPAILPTTIHRSQVQINHIYHWRKEQTTTFIRHRPASTTATTVRISSAMSYTARKGHNYFTYKLSRPRSARKQQQTASNKSLTRTHAFIPYTNMLSNDITANEHIEKIKKHQPICHKHQFPNSLPALEPLPWTSPLLPISTNSITNWTTNPMTKSTRPNFARQTDRQRNANGQGMRCGE